MTAEVQKFAQASRNQVAPVIAAGKQRVLRFAQDDNFFIWSG
jgi:hypothetical protein